MGALTDRTHREFSRSDIDKIAATYHAYSGTSGETYQDKLGFCKKATVEEIAANDYVLTPGRYVGLAKEKQMSKEDFNTEMRQLSHDLKNQFEEDDKLQAKILEMFQGLVHED